MDASLLHCMQTCKTFTHPGYQAFAASYQTVADAPSSQAIVCTESVTKTLTCSCRFEDLLRSLTVERKDICDAMIFALDNADSAFEVHSALPCDTFLASTELDMLNELCPI